MNCTRMHGSTNVKMNHGVMGPGTPPSSPYEVYGDLELMAEC